MNGYRSGRNESRFGKDSKAREGGTWRWENLLVRADPVVLMFVVVSTPLFAYRGRRVSWLFVYQESKNNKLRQVQGFAFPLLFS